MARGAVDDAEPRGGPDDVEGACRPASRDGAAPRRRRRGGRLRLSDLAGQLRDALEALDRPRAEALIRAAAGGRDAARALESTLVPALEAIGDDWVAGRIALSQVYMSGRICEEVVGRLLPAAAPEGAEKARCAIVVLDDHHTLGKRIVLSVLRSSGIGVSDYGRMEADGLAARVLAEDVRILLVSVLMLPAALKVRQVREALRARGSRTRIAVGGAPFLLDRELWREVGADAMGRSAADAASIVRRFAVEDAS